MEQTVIIIGGPTAAGKTKLAIKVARHLGTEIISADSRQCYRELEIGVARPSKAELAAVPHHFIASHSIHQEVTAATFEQYALAHTANLFQHKNQVVMVGGTGLYLKAFCEGFDPVPEVPVEVRDAVRLGFAQNGLPWLQAEVAKADPVFFQVGEIQNPQRMMRALEVAWATGASILHFRMGQKAVRNFNILKIAVDLPREQLHQNIERRVDLMMAAGQLQEAESLFRHQELNALQTVGYRELFSFLQGHTNLPDAVAAIKQNTRRYAKRQLTWFRKDQGYRWFHPNGLEEILAYLDGEINKRQTL